MSARYVFIIILTALVTIILMKNTDEVNFWIFGDARVPKLAVLGVMFCLGLIIGFIARRPRKHIKPDEDYEDDTEDEPALKKHRPLSDEDRDYIS